METNNFYNNSSFNDKVMRGIKDAVYLAKRAYNNEKKLNKLSKPLNNIDTKNLHLSKMATPCFIAKIQKPSFWGKFHLILTNFLNFIIIRNLIKEF